MNPKKSKIYKQDIAQQVGLHEDVVDAFIEFYYQKVREALSNLEYPKIYLTNLGTFNIRVKRVRENLTKQKDMLGNITKQTYNGYEKSVGIKQKIEEYDKILKMYNEIQEQKKNFRKNGSK